MNFKEKRGITLIALVITIVLLLILSFTAINGINSGIVEHAENSAEQSRIAAKKEEIELAIINSQLKKGNEPELNDIIEELKSSQNIKEENIMGNKVKTEPDGYVFAISKTEQNKWEVKYTGTEFEKIELVMPDNTIKENNMEYIFPGNSYQLSLEKAGKFVENSEIKWSTDNKYVSINENGVLTLDNNSTYGKVTIKAEYKGEEFEHVLTTLHKIKLGSNISSMKYTGQDNIELFAENTFKVNDVINSGIAPGESGYTLLALFGYTNTTQVSKTDNNKIVNYAAIGPRLNLQLMDLRQENEISDRLTVSPADVAFTVNAKYSEKNNKLPIKLTASAININGEVKNENIEISYEKANIVNVDPKETIYLKFDFSLPSWNEMNDEEKQEVLKYMTDDIACTISCNIGWIQLD